MTRKIIVHCTGCAETWEADERTVGTGCIGGAVRRATASEAAAYCAQYDEDPTAGFLYEVARDRSR